MIRLAGALGVLFIVLVASEPRVALGGEISAEAIAKEAGFDAADKEKLLKGQVVTRDIPETTDKMLASSVAVIIDADVPAISKMVLSEKTFDVDASVLAKGVIDPATPAAGLADAVFSSSESDEAESFLQAEPGSQFNLSSEEFAKVAAANASGVEAASKLYQEILAARVAAYRSKGLKGVAGYDRGDGAVTEAAQGLTAMTKAATALKQVAPDVYEAFLNYPSGVPADAEERFYWNKRTVEDRPTFILVHAMVVNRPEVLIVLSREFYVGHSYNAGQGVSGVFPTKNGSIVLSGQRTTSDQVAGFMSGTRHSIGRGMMQDELVKKFEALRTLASK